MITAYPVRGKAKSLEICRAFVEGSGGCIADDRQPHLDPNPARAAFFYGVDESNLHLWREVKSTGRDYFYADNSYFDSARQQQYRVTKNRLQHTGQGKTDGARFAALGVEVKPWQERRDGFLLVCPQSAAFMRDVIGADYDWQAETLTAIKAWSSRPVRVRDWNRDKGKLAATLAADLYGAHALVTYSSAAAVTAILTGVPAVVTGADCAARAMATHIASVERPEHPKWREQWAGVLADNQWTLAEMRSGMAWEHLNG